ncbi:MAG: hypothetical protein M0C28_25235 [Candidatus Moduliflexus flocculans]|nr:hypothetical protein [Candidatus Moduliflexus flocculans]
MRRLFALFCLYVGWNFIDPVRRFRERRGGGAAAGTEPETDPRPSPYALLGTGLAGRGRGRHVRDRRREHHRADTDARPALPAQAGHRDLARGHPVPVRPARGPLLPQRGQPRPRRGGLDRTGACSWAPSSAPRSPSSLPSRTVKLLYGVFLLFVAARFFFF